MVRDRDFDVLQVPTDWSGFFTRQLLRVSCLNGTCHRSSMLMGGSAKDYHDNSNGLVLVVQRIVFLSRTSRMKNSASNINEYRRNQKASHYTYVVSGKQPQTNANAEPIRLQRIHIFLSHGYEILRGRSCLGRHHSYIYSWPTSQ